MFDDLTDRTADLMGLADVKRWVVVKTLRDQNVAEHCFLVAVIAMELLARLDLSDDQQLSMQVMGWSLVHDVPETLTGDIDGKFKRDYPSVKEAIVEAEAAAFPWYDAYANYISPKANTIVKLADKIESIAFIRQWGIGTRADDVRYELEGLLFTELVPAAAVALDLNEEEVDSAVRQILSQSTHESNSIQLRRFRYKKEQR